MSMIKYIIRRLIVMIPVLFGVLLITFILSRMMPGDPVTAHLPPIYTIDQYNAEMHRLGFDLPIWQQFFIYLGNLFTGNWGISVSINKGQEVWELIWERFPRTLDITIFSRLPFCWEKENVERRKINKSKKGKRGKFFLIIGSLPE